MSLKFKNSFRNKSLVYEMISGKLNSEILFAVGCTRCGKGRFTVVCMENN